MFSKCSVSNVSMKTPNKMSSSTFSLVGFLFATQVKWMPRYPKCQTIKSSDVLH